jgi:hypothetical protein
MHDFGSCRRSLPMTPREVAATLTNAQKRALLWLDKPAKSFPFEMSGSIMMHPNTPGSADWDLPKKLNDDLQLIFPHGQIVGPEAGKRLREWAETGEVRPPEDKAATGVRELIDRIEDAGTLEALRAITGGEETMKQRFWLSSKRPELAARVDDAVSASLGIFDAADAGDLAA